MKRAHKPTLTYRTGSDCLIFLYRVLIRFFFFSDPHVHITDGGTKIHFTHVDKDEDAVYHCEVKNDVGNIVSTTWLHINGKQPTHDSQRPRGANRSWGFSPLPSLSVTGFLALVPPGPPTHLNEEWKQDRVLVAQCSNLFFFIAESVRHYTNNHALYPEPWISWNATRHSRENNKACIAICSNLTWSKGALLNGSSNDFSIVRNFLPFVSLKPSLYNTIDLNWQKPQRMNSKDIAPKSTFD